jgi:Sulfotransferase domain
MTRSAEKAGSGRAQRTNVPDFFIVGHPKCGTTALFEMLRRHPQLHMPVKEPWFFTPDRAAPAFDGSSPVASRTLQEYLALFDGAAPGQLVGEATPSYLRSPSAAHAIAELQPAARIVAILREPAAFLRSFHLQSVQARIETETNFERALGLEQARRDGSAMPRGASRPADLLYSEHVRYVEQLRRYHAAFAREQVLVLIYDDFRRDNEAVVRQVLRFLAIDDDVPLQAVEANPSVRVRAQGLEHAIDSLSQGRGRTSGALGAAVKTLTPTQLRRRVLQSVQRRLVYAEPGRPDERLKRDLQARFKGEVVALSEYLGRDLVALWGYDEV